PTQDLSINLAGNVTNSDSRTDNFTSLNYPNSIGAASISLNNTVELNGSAIINYDKIINDFHQLRFTAGTTVDSFTGTPVSLSGSGFLSNIYETYNIGSASTINTPSSSYSHWSLLSFLGRINYTF